MSITKKSLIDAGKDLNTLYEDGENPVDVYKVYTKYQEN
jgi:hypothetical protein